MNSVDVLTQSEKQRIFLAMRNALTQFPEAGYCKERAWLIRQQLGVGEVMTFSRTGFSVFDNNFEANVQRAYEFTFPFDSNYYRDIVDWVYHTVFVYKKYVFTYEFPALCMPLKNYRALLNQINGVVIRAHNEKSIRA